MFMLSAVDLLLSPFKLVIDQVLLLMQMAFISMADAVRPFSASIAADVEKAAGIMSIQRQWVKEGFLKTDLPTPTFDISINSTSTVKQDIKLDGKDIGQNQMEIEMRARHGGRGGDPVNPDEAGYIINGSGSVIKVVDIGSLEFL